MSLRVNVNDPNLEDTGFDMNGDMILSYNGVPFTGIEEAYFPSNPTQLWSETEYQNGHMLGLNREYYSNGQVKLEYTKGTGGFDGTYKEWDINGNLIRNYVYIQGVKQ